MCFEGQCACAACVFVRICVAIRVVPLPSQDCELCDSRKSEPLSHTWFVVARYPGTGTRSPPGFLRLPRRRLRRPPPPRPARRTTTTMPPCRRRRPGSPSRCGPCLSPGALPALMGYSITVPPPSSGASPAMAGIAPGATAQLCWEFAPRDWHTARQEKLLLPPQGLATWA